MWCDCEDDILINYHMLQSLSFFLYLLYQYKDKQIYSDPWFSGMEFCN